MTDNETRLIAMIKELIGEIDSDDDGDCCGCGKALPENEEGEAGVDDHCSNKACDHFKARTLIAEIESD